MQGTEQMQVCFTHYPISLQDRAAECQADQEQLMWSTPSWRAAEPSQLDTGLEQTSLIKTFNLHVVHLEWSMYGWMFSISQTDTEGVCI